jgi:hypothetical protein
MDVSVPIRDGGIAAGTVGEWSGYRSVAGFESGDCTSGSFLVDTFRPQWKNAVSSFFHRGQKQTKCILSQMKYDSRR